VILVLSKFLPAMLFPAGLAVLLCLLAAWLAFRKGAAAAGCVALLAGLTLYASASPIVSEWLMRGLERRYPPSTEYPKAAAIVLLAGGMAPSLPPRVEVETNSAGDRPLHAARLWKRGLAPVIVATGGYIPFLTNAKEGDADLYAHLLSEIAGIPDSVILRVPGTRTTHEDALFTSALFDSTGMKKDILLVTSAAHMPRAAALFRKAGFVVHPAPTDYQAEESGPFKVISLFPGGGAMVMTYSALNEYVGMLAYRMLGRL
jgi:uncharacterized SAM-binding protein YcdF (DUF218 family)